MKKEQFLPPIQYNHLQGQLVAAEDKLQPGFLLLLIDLIRQIAKLLMQYTVAADFFPLRMVRKTFCR